MQETECSFLFHSCGSQARDTSSPVHCPPTKNKRHKCCCSTGTWVCKFVLAIVWFHPMGNAESQRVCTPGTGISLFAGEFSFVKLLSKYDDIKSLPGKNV